MLSVPCTLASGVNTISIIFNSAQHSSNWLNLDNLVVMGDPLEQIRITSLTFSTNGTVHLTWNARSGERYRVQFKTGLLGGWSDLGVPITAVGTTCSFDDLPGAGQTRYYRIVE